LALADWALHWPRLALGVGSTLVLSMIALAVFWPGSVPRVDLSQSLDCLALNIYHEARGESLDGRVAVAQVVMNRVGDPEFPGQVCEVVRQGGERPRDRCQFSWWCDGRGDLPDDLVAWTGSKDLARRILAGSVDDPTGGALWYHADHVSPGWEMDIIRRAKIGRHVFYVRK
jgi:spore germination cell wall hydrolase CwlJ-like protein